MKDKKLELTAKIILTIIYLIVFALILYMFVKFSIAVYQWDDDGMFYWGLSIASISGSMFMMFVITSLIDGIWKKKKAKENNYDSSNSNTK